MFKVKYFVRINRSSIRENPSYGVSIDRKIPVRTGEHLIYLFINPEKVDMKNIDKTNFTFYGYKFDFIDEGNKDGLIEIHMTVSFTDDTQKEAFTNLLFDLCSKGVVKHADVQHVVDYVDWGYYDTTEYLFEYEPLEVTCQYCGAKFDHSELHSYWDGIDLYIENECPYCGHSDCVEIEYESLTDDVLREVGLHG